MFRLYFGNGQVSETFASKAAAARAYARQLAFNADFGASSAALRLQRYEGEGEWSTVRLPA